MTVNIVVDADASANVSTATAVNPGIDATIEREAHVLRETFEPHSAPRPACHPFHARDAAEPGAPRRLPPATAALIRSAMAWRSGCESRVEVGVPGGARSGAAIS
jgi:hypothetical protein